MNKKIHKRQASFLLIAILISIFAFQWSILGNDCVSNRLGTDNNNDESFVDENLLNSPPKPSILNTIVYLLGINQSHTVRGHNLTLIGYTQKFTPGATNTSNIPVYPIIDGHKYDGTEPGYANLTVRTSNIGGFEGQFRISYQVPESYAYSSNMIITVNITQIIAENILVDQFSVMTAPISHDITTKASLIVTTNIVNPVLTNDSFWLSFQLRDSTGGAIQIAENLTIFRNLNPVNINGSLTPTTNILGQGNVQYFQENGLMALGLNFTGKGFKMGWDGPYYEVQPVINSTAILRPEWINITFTITNMVDESETQYVYANRSMRVNGVVRANGLTAGTGVIVANRQIRLFINNNTLTTINTDESGSFSYTFNLQIVGFHETDTSFALRVLLLGYDTSIPTGNVTFIDQTLVQVINQPPPTPDTVDPLVSDTGEAPAQNWVAILIPIAIVVGLVVGIVIFQRKRMDMINKRDAMLRAVDKSGKMWIIMNLYNAQRRREAIAYTYKIYTDLFNEKYSVKRENAQTLREFAILTVTKYGQDPLHIYPYVSIIENVIYGAMDVDYAAFEKALTLFGRVFEDLTGTLLNLSLMRNPDTEFDEITIEVVGSIPASSVNAGGSTPP